MIRIIFFWFQAKIIKNFYSVLNFTFSKDYKKQKVPIIAADEKSGKGVDGDDKLLCSIRCWCWLNAVGVMDRLPQPLDLSKVLPWAGHSLFSTHKQICSTRESTILSCKVVYVTCKDRYVYCM